MESRTYGEDTGEDIREGYEPTDDVGVDETGQFAVGDNDEEDNAESEETLRWKQNQGPEILLMPKYGLDGEAFENVWKGGEPVGSPKENV